jgi:poly-gamma-glutamate synthesis protein (capsule biosynthesis protein)
LNINVVYAHWGEEYETIANQGMRDTAELFIENGADLILGSHPHVVQNIDEYKGIKIYYSLGNFVMDQYFDEDVRKGLLVIADISMNGVDIETKYIYLNADGRTTLMNTESGDDNGDKYTK